MSKYLMTLAAVLCCAMVSVVFTSCSKDDDNMGSGLVKQNDQKVIQACDAVYAKHKSDYGTDISGSIQIKRSKMGDSNSEQVIKEYTY